MFLHIGKHVINDQHIVRAEWAPEMDEYRLFVTEVGDSGGVVIRLRGVEAEAAAEWLASEAIDVVAVLTQAQAQQESLERRHESIGDVLFDGGE